MLYMHSHLRYCQLLFCRHQIAIKIGSGGNRRRSTTFFAAIGLVGRRQPSTATAESVDLAENLKGNGQQTAANNGNPETTAHQHSTGPNRRSSSSSVKSIEMPPEITKRLDTLKRDLLDALVDKQVSKGLYSLADNPLQFTRDLQEMAKYYFGQGGKLIRPTISLLMSAACNQHVKCSSSSSSSSSSTTNTSTSPISNFLPFAAPSDIEISQNQYRIAMVAEMIHNATLVHDDVIDESDTRRGMPTVSARWGIKQAVLVGDFILARATKVLASIGQPKVIEIMAEIVENLVQGEVMQLKAPASDSNSQFQHYMVKTFYKTGSLFANSCKSVAMLSGCDEAAQHLATEFGRNLGLAFQVVDDVLDYVASAAELGKPTATDLRLGLATCPVLFAAREFPELETLIKRRFAEFGDVEKAMELVHRSKGLQNSRQLARKHGEAAIENVMQLLPQGGKVRECLISIVERQLERDR